jgi:hypothetical protein
VKEMKRLKRQLPKFSFGFYKDGFQINSKKFSPLNMDLGPIKLESDNDYKPVDAMELLDSFSSIDVDKATTGQKISALKAMLEKISPQNLK